MSNKKVPEINASSNADIAFLLLIFFLVSTTMATDKGLSRRLPPPLPPDAEKPDIDVKERNIFTVMINSQNQLMVEGEPLDIRDLRQKVKEFIANETNDPELPERLPISVDFGGGKVETIMMTKNHVISLQNNRDTKYAAYIEVQNELVAAYNELRQEYAMNKFGTAYDELDPTLQKAIQKIYPQKISEAEPKRYGQK